jgi:hypothetical protein
MDSFKRHIVVMTLFAMFVQINGVLACYGLFYFNQKSIAETVCEKKTRNCCGHCFLKKKIAEASGSRPEDSRKHPAAKSIDEPLSVMLGIKPDSQHSPRVPVAGRKYSDCLNCTLCTGSSPGIDHPPKA